MRIPSFSVQNQRAVRLAACDLLPPVTILTGPNGCGKSTLLNALRSVGGDGRILYIGPHRTSRRQNVRMRFLGQHKIEMGALLSSQNLPGFEGITVSSNDRDAWNFDEAQSHLKYSLCQIEIDRQAAITERYDIDGTVTKAEMPDVWTPLREMAANLLPHLSFKGIDAANRDAIRCLWQVHQKEVQVDLDDLSSGEKAVIQLFFPLVEHHITERLAAMRKQAPTVQSGSIAVLMDEPELHLHPNLQGKVLDYIRRLSLAENVQFILATHSPSIVESATSEELYLLRPTELVPGHENQLVRVSSDDEKLQVLRDLFGSTSNVTAMRRILVVEGGNATQDSRRASDARIYGFLSDKFGQVTIVSGGGRTQCEQLVERLNSSLAALSPGLSAVAVVDRDVDEAPLDTGFVRYLPVSMIENLLVDPEVLWQALEIVRHKLSLTSVADVGSELSVICDSVAPSEIDRRVKPSVSSMTFRLKDPIVEAKQQVEAFAVSLFAATSTEKIQELESKAQAAVALAAQTNRRREYFDGKLILDIFFKKHVSATGMSKEIFLYSCAREASARTSVKEFVTALFEAIGVEASASVPAS